MTKRSSSNRINWKYWVIAGVLTISVAYGVAMTDVLRRTVRSSGRVEALQSEVQELEDRIAELNDQIRKAQSPAYVEEIAREEFKAKRDGEVVMVPIIETAQTEATPAPPTPTPRPTPRPTTSGSLPARWQELMRLVLRGVGRQ